LDNDSIKKGDTESPSCFIVTRTVPLTIINIPLYVGISAFTLSAIAFCSVFTWALFGSVISKHLHNTRIKSALNITLGLLLVYTAVRLSGLLL